MKKIAIIFTLLSSLFAVSANASVITTSGTLTGSAGSVDGFDLFNFNVTTAGITQFSLIGNTDPYLFLFSGTSNVFSASTFIDSDDDGGAGLNSYISTSLAVGSYTAYIASHGTYWAGTSFLFDHTHNPMNYTLTITGAVVSTPEPATLALFGLGLLGFGLRRRKSA